MKRPVLAAALYLVAIAALAGALWFTEPMAGDWDETPVEDARWGR